MTPTPPSSSSSRPCRSRSASTGSRYCRLLRSRPEWLRSQDKSRMSPYWDHDADAPKLIKLTTMQVQIGFDWFKVLQAAQKQAGVAQIARQVPYEPLLGP